MKKIFFVLICLLASKTIFAGDVPQHRWSFGVMAGGGYESLGDNDFFAHFGPSVSYRFTVPISLRLAAGAFYLQTPDHTDIHEYISLSGLWHIVENKRFFQPYLVGGFDAMPSAFDYDLHIGLGNNFRISDHLGLFIESAYNNNYITAVQNNDPTRHVIRMSTGLTYGF